MQPSREHSLRHCFPLNFLRIPLLVQTTSPFLYFCCTSESGVREREEDMVGVEEGVWVGVVLAEGRLELERLILALAEAGGEGSCWGLDRVGRFPRATARWGEEDGEGGLERMCLC